LPLALPDIFDFFIAIKRENALKKSYDPVLFDNITYQRMKKMIRKAAPGGNIFSMNLRKYLYLLPSCFGIVKTMRLYWLLLLPGK